VVFAASATTLIELRARVPPRSAGSTQGCNVAGFFASFGLTALPQFSQRTWRTAEWIRRWMRICTLMDAVPSEEMKTLRTTDATAGPIDVDAADLTRTPFERIRVGPKAGSPSATSAFRCVLYVDTVTSAKVLRSPLYVAVQLPHHPGQ